MLRGDFKQSQYGRVILPFTLLRRLEGVLEATKPAVLAEYDKVQQMNLPEEAEEKLLLRATGGLSFSIFQVRRIHRAAQRRQPAL
ncbi:MAG: type I restriction-modification system subunit M N-terminal domain-containing protein [Desulforhopalus sp.]|nr:type I restriction-modification system subunit M N-terminal domain-containing protein [Desulforhopalus sp.]